MSIDAMLEFLEDDENASYLACDYNNPKQILAQIAAALRAGQEMRDKGVFGHDSEAVEAAQAWDAAVRSE